MAVEPSERYPTAEQMGIDLAGAYATASAERVAAWLQEVAGPSLARRAALLAGKDGPSVPPPPVGSRKRTMVFAGLLVLLAFLLLVALKVVH